MEKETVWVEFNELVFNRKNPKYIYKDKNASEIFGKIKKGNLVYWKRDGLVWSSEVARVSSRIRASGRIRVQDVLAVDVIVI